MITTSCSLGERSVPLAYEMTLAEGLTQFEGKIFTEKPLHFCFVQVSEKTPVLFAPNDLEKSVKDAIIYAVKESERKSILAVEQAEMLASK
ncbi:MAG TPA: hypothetical protein VKR32_02240 [Puia sp.]|nr:hypothetical protein [Puia sp.]